MSGLSTRTVWLGVVALAGLIVGGCNPQLGEYHHRKREYQPPVEFPQQSEKAQNGAVWTPSMQGNFLFTDQRARQAGDLVTVLVREEANARREAATRTSRDANMSTAITGFLSVLSRFAPEMLDKDLLGFESGNDFTGTGATSRSERLQATIPATVMKVLPNGNLFVEGTRTILVNREEHRFYISGVVRPADIDDQNVVLSSRVAEAEIEFNGRGVLSDKQGPGYLIRALDQYTPF